MYGIGIHEKPFPSRASQLQLAGIHVRLQRGLVYGCATQRGRCLIWQRIGARGLAPPICLSVDAARYRSRHVDAARPGAWQDRRVAPPAASDWSRIALLDAVGHRCVRGGARKPENLALSVRQIDPFVCHQTFTIPPQHPGSLL